MFEDDKIFTTTDIKALRQELRTVRDQIPQEMKEGLDDAISFVIPKIRSIVPHRSGFAQSSIVPASTKTVARIKTVAPYFQFLDFGGSTGRGHQKGVPFSGAIKRNWAGNPVGEGRYIYPTIRKERQAIIRAVDKVVTKLGEQLGDVGGNPNG